MSGAQHPAPVAAAPAGIDAARLVRPTAAFAVVAMLLGRAAAPALQGLAPGLQRVVEATDFAAGTLSHLLALLVSALCIGVLLSVVRFERVSLVTRVLLVALTGLVLFACMWAARARLPPVGSLVVGCLSGAVAGVGTVEALRQPRTRAIGVVLGLTALAALVRVLAAGVLALLPEPKALAFSPAASVLATCSSVLHLLALLVALVWIATRRRTVAPPSTMLSLALAVLASWAAAKGARAAASVGYLFVARALERLTPSPTPALHPAVVTFVAALGPVLAGGAVLTPRQIPSVTGALALALVGGVLLDAPAHALIVTLASLAAVLASRDDRAMWEALLGRPARQGPSRPA
jgi:hypothetical protein